MTQGNPDNMKTIVTLFATCAMMSYLASWGLADENVENRPHFRKPVAIAVTVNGQLVTANERSGSISLLEGTESLGVLSETVVGKSLSDIAVLNSSYFLVTDFTGHELILIKQKGAELNAVYRLAVSSYPVSVRISGNGTRAFVASLWSRTITVVDVPALLENVNVAGRSETANRPLILMTVTLTFAPREMLAVSERERLIVADAFGPRLAVIDPAAGTVESIRELPAHGLRCLQRHPGKPRLLFTHQMLSRLAQTTFDDVHWGSLMVNCLRSLSLESVLDPQADPLLSSRLDYIGGPEQGAADPAGFVIRSDDTLAMALSGTNEVVFDEGNHLYSRRIKVGDQPTKMVLAPDGSNAFVINSLADSVSMVNLDRRTLIRTASLGPTPEATSVDRGERLFHSAALSHDRWFSCSSCHINGHTSGLLNDNLTDGTFGTAKRILSLRGVGDTAPYAWNGRFASLSEQIQHSIRSTMQGDSLTDMQTADLEAYLRALPPITSPPPIDTAAVERGATLFEQFECRKCHTSPTLTSPRVVDVRLADEKGQGKFNPPSLRGVIHNGPYFHDGRALTLYDVFLKFQHQVETPLSDEQARDLVAYLSSL